MAKRYKIVFSDEESYQRAGSLAAAAAVASPWRLHREFGRSLIQVQNPRRLYIGVEPSTQGIETLSEKQFERQLESFHDRFGARIVEDYQYHLETDIFDPNLMAPDDPNSPSLDDVLTLIEAKEAWHQSTGEGTALAVVDTGIDGTRLEFPSSKRVGEWQPLNDRPWTDGVGHGTMCAVIAAGTKREGGSFDGVAPGASLICCKTGFYDSELGAIYDYLTDLVTREKLTIIATNSFGVAIGNPPPVPQDSEFIPALNDAIAAGIHVFFSAGNYHEYAGGAPESCEPNSIWLHKSRADVMTVAACDMDSGMWYYSSRGPGQHFGDPNTDLKPDVTAPTPRNGRIVYGSTIRSLPNGWGTSGACPQAAGLAALLLGKNRSLSRADIKRAIVGGANQLAHVATCSGAGIINCRQSMNLV